MLVYAVVLIGVMLLTNNRTIKNFLNSLREKIRGNEEKKGGILEEIMEIDSLLGRMYGKG